MLDPSAAVVLALAAFVQGVFGFGFGIVAMGLLTMTHDLAWASGVVNLTTFVQSASMLAGLRGAVLWRVVWRFLPGIVLGLVAGTAALASLDRALMARLLGATIVLVAGWNLTGVRTTLHESPAADGIAGLLGGLLSGAFNTGGPPIIVRLYGRAEPPDVLKATIQVVFLAMGVLRVPAAAAHGLFDGAVVRAALLGAPVVAIGATAGMAVARRIAPERFRRACWGALGALGVVLLATG